MQIVIPFDCAWDACQIVIPCELTFVHSAERTGFLSVVVCGMWYVVFLCVQVGVAELTCIAGTWNVALGVQ